MNTNFITTKYGTFEIVNNENGGTSLFIGKAKICEFPKVAWWNLDAIETAIEQHHEVIEKRVNERVNEVDVTRENAPEVVARLIEVLGNEGKGFYASRLKQCLNKLLAA
jgi:hypothetical protein